MISTRFSPVVKLLADGSVFVTGGWNGNELTSAELYHPDTNEWTETAPMAEGRTEPGVAGLPDGRVLVAGGNSWVDGHPAVSTSSEIYDPCTGVWSNSGPLNTPRGGGLQLTTLADGRPVISGGAWFTDVHQEPDGQWKWWNLSYEKTAEVFDPLTGTWTQSPPMVMGRAGHVAVALKDGSLLVAGGIEAGTLAERYKPAPAATPTATPAPAATPTATATPVPATGGIPVASAAGKRPTVAAFLSQLPRRLNVSRAGTIAMRLRCTGPGACLDHLVLRLHNGEVLARTRVRIPHGRAQTVRIKLSKAARAKLARTTTKVTLELTSRRIAVKATIKR